MNIIKQLSIFGLVLIIANPLLAQNNHVKKADQYFNNFDFLRAISAYEKVVKKDSTNSYAMHQIGEAYRLIGENQKANPWYGLVLRLKPESKDDLYYYARTLLTVGQYDKALETYRKYNQLYPGDSRASIYVEHPDFYKELNLNKDKYEIFTLPINSERSDYGPSKFYNQLLITSSREREYAIKRKSTWKNEPFLDLYTIDLFTDGTFGEPKIIGEPITTKWHEGSASYNYMTDVLYFTRTSYFDDELSTDAEGITNIEIYASHYGMDGSWGEIIPFPFNNKEYSIAQPALSPDGKKLYFVSDMPGGLGGVDIYVCEKAGDTWGEPRNLGAPINTASHEKNPYIDSQGFLYFASTGHLGLGGMDIYYAAPKGDNFEYPVNMGFPVNTRFDDFSFTFEDYSEMSFFFASNREGGMGEDDVYRTVIHEVETIIAGNVIIKESLENTPIKVIVSDARGNLLTSDTLTESRPIELSAYSKFTPLNLGFYPLFEDKPLLIFKDIDPETAEEGVINKGDIVLGEDIPEPAVEKDEYIAPDEFGIVPSSDRNQGDLYFIKLPSGEKLEYRAKPIYFGFDKYDLDDNSIKELDLLLEILKADRDIKLTISGYTDSRGSKTYNLKLSERRATATLNYLVENGIDASRIVLRGYGEENMINNCPDGVNCSNKEHAANRRNEFELSK